MIRKVILVALMLGMFFAAFGQKGIVGVVISESGQALEGVNVSVATSSLGAVTVADGSFELPKAKGTVVLQFSCLGFQSHSEKVSAGNATPIKIVLETAAIVYDDFDVTATRAGADAPFAISDINTEELSARNAGKSLPEVLKLTPSLVTSSENGTPFGNTKFRIRGSDPSRINVTLDGIPLNDAESQAVFWVNQTDIAESLNDIQIQRGVGASTNGSPTFGASVNMQSKGYDANPFAEYSSYAGSFNTFKNSVQANTGLIKDHFVFNARLSKLTSDGYIKHTGMDNNSYFFSGGYFSDKTTFRVKVFGNEEHTDISWWGVDPETMKTDRRYNPAGIYTDKDGVEQYYEDQKDNYWQNNIHAHFSHKLSDELQLKAALHYTHGTGYYEQMKDDETISDYGYNNPIVLTQNVNDTIVTSDIARQKWLDNDFYGGTFSLEYNVENLQLVYGASANRYDGDHFGKLIWAEFNPGIPVDYQYYFNNGVKDDIATFAKATYNVTSQLSAYADIQYRYVNYVMSGLNDDLVDLAMEETYSFVNPKAGLAYNTGKHRAFASFGISNREPSRANLKDAVGDPNATPRVETLYDTELGYQFSASNFTAAANLFYMGYNDQLVPTGEKSSSGYDIMTNVEESYRTGIELSMAFKPFAWVKWDANVTFSQNKIVDFTEYIDDVVNELGTTNIAYSPNAVGASALTFYPVKNLSIMFNSKYVGDQYFDNTSQDAAKLDAYLVNDLMVGYRLPLDIVEYVELKFMINNVFSEDYISDALGGKYIWDGEQRWTSYFPQAFRNYAVKLSVRF